MKIELIFEQCIEKILTFDFNDSDYEEYINWCQENSLDIEGIHNLVEFLELNCNYEEDVDVDYSNLEDYTGLDEIIKKCKELINDNTRNTAEISGNNPETK